MFEVVLGEDVKTFSTRQEAIQAARLLSAEHRGLVAITDPDGRERMTYQGGELISYDYEIRRE